MTAPHPTEHPHSPTSPDPGNQITDHSGGAVTLLLDVLRHIESWQCAMRSGKGVQESMADVGCEIDDFLDRGEG